jgi:hypothetical protein
LARRARHSRFRGAGHAARGETRGVRHSHPPHSPRRDLDEGPPT